MQTRTFSQTLDRPGGPIEPRELVLAYLNDVSGSMSVDGKIAALNQAMHASIPDVKANARKHPHVRTYGQAITFGTGARLLIPKTPIEQFEWHDVAANAERTDMGAAFDTLADVFMKSAQERALRPLVILTSDGGPTDDWRLGLQKLQETELGKKAIRVAIAIGQSADRKMLHAFMGGDPEFRPLEANNAEQLADRIKWASTTFINHISESRNGAVPFVPNPSASFGTTPWK